MKKIIKGLILSFFLLLCVDTVKANTINSIKMDIYIDSNGDAHITETWDATLSQGTEGYRFFGNMGDSEITNYSVSDESTQYQTLSYWDTSASFSEKAYKAGIYDAKDHDELCFGISRYGTHTYTLKYTITGFVAETDDSQIVYWELIPTDLAKLTDDVYIKIHADNRFSDSLDVWGYGNYGGYAYVYDGYIEMSNDSLDNDEYMTILVKFDKGTFNTSNVVGNNFDHYYDMAEEGAEHYQEQDQDAGKEITILAIVLGIISMFFSFIPALVYIGIIFYFIKFTKNKSTLTSRSGSRRLEFGVTGKKIASDIPMFRDLPCNKDIYRAYWVAHNYNLMRKQTDFLGAILLKWLSQDKIKIESRTVGALFKKEDTTIIFSDPNCQLDNELEISLYKYMYEASKDGVLESKEFEKWCKNNYSKILDWFDKILDYENKILHEEGKLVEKEKVTLKIFKSKVYEVDSSMMEEAKQMKGLKKFFEEFDNMTDKEAIQVKLWQEYLMYAQIFGVADKVAKQFKKLYPEVITDYSYESIVFVNEISYSGMSSAASAKSRAEARSSSYSSGGGGRSSGGGGGDSFGGGGGGGFR